MVGALKPRKNISSRNGYWFFIEKFSELLPLDFQNTFEN